LRTNHKSRNTLTTASQRANQLQAMFSTATQSSATQSLQNTTKKTTTNQGVPFTLTRTPSCAKIAHSKLRRRWKPKALWAPH